MAHIDLKWTLAILLEVAFWVLLVSFLVLRYRFGIESITKWFVVAIVVDTVAIVALGVWDFAVTGKPSTYTLFIAGLLIYSLTWGHRDLKRLDRWMARKLAPRERAGPR